MPLLLIAATFILSGCAAVPYPRLTNRQEQALIRQSSAATAQLATAQAREAVGDRALGIVSTSTIAHGIGAVFSPFGYVIAWTVYPEGLPWQPAERVRSMPNSLRTYYMTFHEVADERYRRYEFWGKILGGVIGTTIWYRNTQLD